MGNCAMAAEEARNINPNKNNDVFLIDIRDYTLHSKTDV
jgi:hypothetical protein